MQIEFDNTKRDQALAERGLNFARVGEVRRIISMRKSNEREIKTIGNALG